MADVTQILSAIEQGDPHAGAELLPLVYDEMRKLAAIRMAEEKPGQTLQPTALVHEAYLRLVSTEQSWNSRGHFFAAAAEAMRRILMNRARDKGRLMPVLFWAGVYAPHLVYDLHPSDGRRRDHLPGYVANVLAILAVHGVIAWVIGPLPYLVAAVGGFVGWGVVYESLFTRHQHLGLLPVPAGQEHYATPDQVQFSRSVDVPLAGLLFYFNLHKEHHLFPGLPFRYLPGVRDAFRRLRPDVYGFTARTRRRPGGRARPRYPSRSPSSA